MLFAMLEALAKVTRDVLKTVLLAGIVKIILEEKMTTAVVVATMVSFMLIITIETLILVRRRK